VHELRAGSDAVGVERVVLGHHIVANRLLLRNRAWPM
jgi:hypothetical protein